MLGMFSQASGISIIIECRMLRPEAVSSSSASSSEAVSEPIGQITGSRSLIWPPQTAEVSSGSRALIQLRLPSSVLISPLCATSRNGCASFQLGSVFVAKRWWNSATAATVRSSERSG